MSTFVTTITTNKSEYYYFTKNNNMLCSSETFLDKYDEDILYLKDLIKYDKVDSKNNVVKFNKIIIDTSIIGSIIKFNKDIIFEAKEIQIIDSNDMRLIPYNKTIDNIERFKIIQNNDAITLYIDKSGQNSIINITKEGIKENNSESKVLSLKENKRV